MTYVVMATCGAVFYFTLTLPSTADTDRMITAYSVVPAQFTGHVAAMPAALPVRLVTSLFLHGGWLHLGGNMLFLWIFGDNIEDAMGHGAFVAFYLLSGVLANLAHILANPLSTEPTIGASGAIAGVLGAYLVLYPRARVLLLMWWLIFVRFIWVRAVIFLPVWVLLQFMFGVESRAVPHSGAWHGGLMLAGSPVGWCSPASSHRREDDDSVRTDEVE